MNTFGPAMEPVTALLPGVRRFVAPNPSMMTGPGTNTYLFGEREIAVLDPGPVLDAHLEHIRRDAGGTIRWILVTHTHPDHSPGASVLAKLTGAELLGRPAPEGDHQDATFVPDRILDDGDSLATDEFELMAVHTPGHASNHLCYRHAASNWLFTGDHVIDGSTVVIDPPDGNMKQYLNSLRRVIDLGVDSIVPGHGEVVSDPERLVNWIIDHRLERETKVANALQANPGLTSHDLVPHVYQDVPNRLYGWAERSLLAHLIKLEEDGRAKRSSDRWSLVG
ncbi:MAG: MBL fold metallo-hydrolase [Woeseiaceae bacterium]|nr:MBL fold metallo-hydrolase [Woeseiaceae bacterium]